MAERVDSLGQRRSLLLRRERSQSSPSADDVYMHCTPRIPYHSGTILQYFQHEQRPFPISCFDDSAKERLH